MLDVVAAYPYEEIVGLKSPEGVIIGENGKLWMHGKLVGPVVVAGESACIELHVKNHSNKKVSLFISFHVRWACANSVSISLLL